MLSAKWLGQGQNAYATMHTTPMETAACSVQLASSNRPRLLIATCVSGSTADVVGECKAGTHCDGKYCSSCIKSYSAESTAQDATCQKWKSDSVTDLTVFVLWWQIWLFPCSTCARNANTTKSCSSTADDLGTCNIGFYGDGFKCTKLQETPSWINNLAIALELLPW